LRVEHTQPERIHKVAYDRFSFQAEYVRTPVVHVESNLCIFELVVARLYDFVLTPMIEGEVDAGVFVLVDRLVPIVSVDRELGICSEIRTELLDRERLLSTAVPEEKVVAHAVRSS
jgi:hypothetical protein